MILHFEARHQDNPPMTTSFASAFFQAWLMTAGLIVAIGAQNALVLRQGLARTHVGPVVVVCTVSDWLLIALGVFGLGAVIQSSPLLLQIFRVGGVAFLVIYGLRSAHKAWRGQGALFQADATRSTLGATLASTLALTFLNPHVYLDTVVLLGSVGAQHGSDGRIAFAAGAGLASMMWFLTLGYGAAAASPWLRHPAAWRAIDAGVAVVMFGVAAQLLFKRGV
jgi:L-lysine exporter family protein LysE/ArgO